jgi:hypothetical protein
MYFSPSIGTFRVIVKQLEESKKLIDKSEAEYSRMAIVLIDNIIEILLFNYLKQAIKDDYESSWSFQPKFSNQERDAIDKHFDKKIKAIKKTGVINDDDASTLRIIHSYRNSIYHHDFHNPITVNKFAELYFVVASRLFKRIHNVGVVIGGCGEEWLKRYGLKIDYINFQEASEKITSCLLNGFYISLVSIKKIISKDLSFRINEVTFVREHELPWLKNDIILDSSLRVAEYFDKNPYLSEKYNNLLREFLTYKNSSKNEDASKKWLEVKLEEKQRDEKIEKVLKNFKQTISSQTLKQSLNFLRKIKNYHKINKLLENYYLIDKNLLKLELYLNQFIEEFDREVQREIDIRRGK